MNRQASWVTEVDRFVSAAKRRLGELSGNLLSSSPSTKNILVVGAVGFLAFKILEEEKRMSIQQKKRVFLSFAYEDVDKVNGLRGLIQNPNHELEAYDESVREPINSRNADYIKRRIREKRSGVHL